MKKFFSLPATLAAFLVAGASCASAAVTINLGGGVLRDSSGTAMVNGGLVLLVASTTDSIFTGPSSNAATTVGSFLSSDDLIVGAFSVSSSGSGIAGGYTSAITINYSGNLASSDLLQLYWFPTLTTSSSAIGEGTSYGIYRTDSVSSPGSEISWALPSDGTTVVLNFLTSSAGGSLADSLGNATLTTVPEPATTVALLGGASGLFVMYRRRQRKAITTTPVA